MRTILTFFLLAMCLSGCGPDKELLMETKFDAALRQKVSSIGENEAPQMLAVVGKCDTIVDANMRQDLMDAGADVVLLEGNNFTANVSSQDVFKMAALDFVNQVQLSRESKPRR